MVTRGRSINSVQRQNDVKKSLKTKKSNHHPTERIESEDGKGEEINDNEFEQFIKEIKKVKGAAVDIYYDDSKINGIYFQTKEMMSSFAAFPEILLVDASLMVAHLKMTMYALMNADGNGESVIVCVWFVLESNRETLTFLTENFKERNPDWHCINVFMADKDLKERNTLHALFPNAVSFICFFHAVRSFQKEISPEKLGVVVPVEEQDLCLGLVKKMALAKNENSYYEFFDEFKSVAPRPVLEHFLKSWHKVQDQWVDGLKSPHAYFLNQTNNRLSAITQVLRSACDNFQSVPQFFHDLMQSIMSLQVEREDKALSIGIKIPLERLDIHIAQVQYQNFLTPYSFNFVRRQLHFSPKIHIDRDLGDELSVIESNKYGQLVVGISTCPCVFSSSTNLPCSHIFAVRRHKCLPIYDESLCAERWTINYLRQSLLPKETKTDVACTNGSHNKRKSLEETPSTDGMRCWQYRMGCSNIGAGGIEGAPSVSTSLSPSGPQPHTASGEIIEDIAVDHGDRAECWTNSVENEERVTISPGKVGERSGSLKRKRESSPDLEWIGLQETL